MLLTKATYNCCAAFLLAIIVCCPACALGISISRTADISFGQLISGTFGGTVSISPAGLRTAVGVAVVPSSGSSQAVFQVTGDANVSYAIVLPTSVLLSGSGADMTLDTFMSSPSDTGMLDAIGAQTLYVGATLHVNASQQAGGYEGTIDVSVAYE